MIRINEGPFRSEGEADEVRDRIYTSFHPAGYGTQLEVSSDVADLWWVKGSRATSCD